MPSNKMLSLSRCWYWLGTLFLGRLVDATAPKFSTSGLFDVDVGLADVDGVVAAFGDVNGDKFTDIFVLNTAQTSVVAYKWNHGRFGFEQLPGTALSFNPTKPKAVTIVNVIPGDYNYDGKLDVLLMGQEKVPDGDLLMRIFFGNGVDAFNATGFLDLDASTPLQPFAVDYSGTMRPQLLGYPSSKKGVLSLWSPSLGNGTTSEVPLNAPVPCSLAHPHSNAFLDFNGDCLADMFLTCDAAGKEANVQIWLNTQEGFVFSKQYTLPEGAGPITFADIDGDGTMDMVFPSCDSQECYIHVAYNQQIPLCATGENANCRNPHNLCTADNAYSFRFDENSSGYVKVPLSRITQPKERFLLASNSLKGNPPIPLRIGDFNNDGYPDLLATTTNGVRLLRSIPCTTAFCSSAAVDGSKRAFELVRGGTDALAKPGDETISATFIDLDEDGTLDIIVGVMINGVYRTRAIFNNFYNDAFFLKGLVSNGVCPAWCPSGVKFPSPKPYGVNYVGASFKYTVFDTAGRRRATQAAQLSQTTYFSLQTPYTLFGLGRTNNYIEDLFVGVSRRKVETTHVATYQGVIPNSQLIVIPYEPDAGADPNSWILELYINPSSASKSVMLVICTSLIVLMSVVAGLHWTEKREDEKERRKRLHLLNFDAL